MKKPPNESMGKVVSLDTHRKTRQDSLTREDKEAMKDLLETAIQNGKPFVLAVLDDDVGFQVGTDLTVISALGLLNMATEGLIGELMKMEKNESTH